MNEHYSCKIDKLSQLIDFKSDKVRWVDVDKDFDLIHEYYSHFSDKEAKKEDFSSDQWKFCALIEDIVY